MATKVFITGASGNTGRAVANATIAVAQKNNLKVAVGVRSKEKGAEFAAKADVVLFDFNEHDKAVAALKGVERVWITPPNPAKTDKAFDRTNAAKKGIDAAKAAGVKFILLGSVAGAEYEAITFAKEFRDAEKHLEKSGVAYTHLRMGPFSENVLMSQAAFAQGAYYQPLTKGAFCPLSVTDIGEIAALILSNPTPHIGKAYTLSGPAGLTGDQQAAILTKVLGKPIKHVNPGPEGFKAALAPFMPPYQVDGMLELYAFLETGGASQPSPDFEKVTGHKAQSFEQTLTNLKQAGALKA